MPLDARSDGGTSGGAASGPRAVVLGCAGEELGLGERRFFAAADPAGFILFRRNCAAPEQVRGLVEALRDSVGRADAPVLIDQEGGRVARLRPAAMARSTRRRRRSRHCPTRSPRRRRGLAPG